jgi:hypothetical protein
MVPGRDGGLYLFLIRIISKYKLRDVVHLNEATVSVFTSFFLVAVFVCSCYPLSARHLQLRLVIQPSAAYTCTRPASISDACVGPPYSISHGAIRLLVRCHSFFASMLQMPAHPKAVHCRSPTNDPLKPASRGYSASSTKFPVELRNLPGRPRSVLLLASKLPFCHTLRYTWCRVWVRIESHR